MSEIKLSVWEQVQEHAAHRGCRCDLRPHMTWWDLLKVQSCVIGSVCPVLARYREKVGIPGPQDPTRVAEDIRLAKLLGLGRLTT